MEKDIEILEDNKDMFIDTLYECYRQSAVKPFEKAIENLINRVKELEEDNKHQWEERCKMAIELDNDVITKSKIKEKIEELEKLEKGFNFTGLITECETKIEVLQELLEE